MLLALFVGKAMAEPKAKYWVGTTTDDIVTQIVAKRISKEFNIEFVFVSYPDFAVKLAAIEVGEVDFISNVTYSEERAEKLYFSAPTNVENTYFFSDRRKNYQDITTVGVPLGTAFSEFVIKHAPTVSIVEYRNIVEAKQLIEDGVVDGVIDTMANLKFMALAGFSVRLLNYDIPLKPVSIVTSKPENLAMLKKMEAYLYTAEIQRFIRESSEYYQFEVQRQSLRKQVLLSGLNINTPFKVKVENYNQLGNYLPDGSVNGIAADVVFEACQLMRIECVLESHADESRQSMYNSLIINNEIDILSPIAMIKERQLGAHISNSFLDLKPSS